MQELYYESSHMLFLQHDTELVSGHFGDKSNTLNGLIIVTSSFIFASDMKLGVQIDIY